MSEDLNSNSSKLVTSGDQLFNDSFNRFDDNLLETILSFLTFSEKVLFESVSKRWKTHIYRHQKEFCLTRWQTDEHNSVNDILEPLEVIDFTTSWAAENGLKAINKSALISILKKCPSIESVDIDCFVDFEALDIIGQNCPHLNSLKFDTTGVTAYDLDLFGQRYGHKIESIRFYYPYPYVFHKYSTHLLTHCKNLKKFSSPRTQELISKDNDYLSKLIIIDSFPLYLDRDEEPDLMSKFNFICKKYSETLRVFYVHAYWPLTPQHIQLFFSGISELKNLRELSLNFETSDEFTEGVDKYLFEISEKNPFLTFLNFSLYTNCAKIDQIFCAFDGFKELVELDIYIKLTNNENQNKVINGSVKCFKSLEKLKTLKLMFEYFREEFFEDIDIYFPNLSSLIIGCETEITDKTIHQLSHLKRLKRFNLNKYRKCNTQITDDSVCAIIRNCPLLDELYFGSRPYITNKTIDALISCANTYPKRRLHFECGLADIEDQEFPHLDLLTYIPRIPDNLIIIIDEL